MQRAKLPTKGGGENSAPLLHVACQATNNRRIKKHRDSLKFRLNCRCDMNQTQLSIIIVGWVIVMIVFGWALSRLITTGHTRL